jgi:predicted DNA-binding transcriptional regulator YafY
MLRPTARVLALLELLQSQSQIGGVELARRLDVDRRTLRRYITLLEEIGIPITAERGPYGGYRLVPGFKLPPMMFNEDEVQALSLGLLAARGLGLSDLAPAIEAVQAKLDRVLPGALKKSNAALRESIALHTNSCMVRSDPKLLRQLSEAAQARHTVLLDYVAADGNESTRKFDVFGLVFRDGRWYMVGHCHLRMSMRTLRVDRVAHAEVSQLLFTRPKAFDPAGYLTQTLATLPRALTIEVLLRTDLATARQQVFEMLGTLETSEDGVLLRGTADDLEWYARQLIGLPFAFVVRTPVALGTTLARLAQKLAEQFRPAATTATPTR